MNVLVLNCGSSTVKFQIIATDLDRIAQDADERLARGLVERIGGEAIITFEAAGVEARRSTAPVRDTRAAVETRSEEHTSELQSRSDLVCRLLLEKKKKKRTTPRPTP